MKKLICTITLLWSVSVYAQKNSLLEGSFWQTKPTVDAIKAEIEKGANPAQLNPSGFDPVVMAINADAPNETIKYLLSLPGNDVAKLTHDGRIYLHWAAYRGNDEITAYLISKGAAVGSIDSHGTSPLTFAAGAGQQNIKIYDLFAAKGVDLKAEKNGSGANLLLLAISGDQDLKLTDYFVSKGLDIKSTDNEGHNAFGYAAKSGRIDVLKALIAKGVPIDNSAILLAGEGTRRGAPPVEVFKYLESLKIKPGTLSKDGRNVLHAIVRKPGQNALIEHFIKAGVDVNQADADGNTVLMNAASANRDTAAFAILLPEVKNINQANAKGITALAMAVNSNSPAVVKLLIEKGADLSVVDHDGNNLAYYLVQSYYPETGRPAPAGMPSRAEEFTGKLALLQAKGFNIATPQKNGNTLYHLAVAKGDIALVKRFRDLSVDVNAKNKEGITPLHKAAMISKDDSMLKYLLSIGAKKDPKTSFDESAFDLASENESLSKANVSLSFLK